MMAETDSMLTAEERLLRRRRRRRWFLAIVSLLLLAATVVFAARPVRHAIKGWQARRHARRAFAYIDQEKWREARDEATAAYRLRSDEPEALRAVARLLSRANQPAAFEFWKKLEAIEPLTRGDLQEKATVALKANDLANADAAVQQLLENDREKPTAADWLLAADVCGRRHQYARAAEFAEKALAEPQLSRREEYQAVLILETVKRDGGAKFVPNPKKIDERIAAIASSDDDVALDALTALSHFVPAAPLDANASMPLRIEELSQKLENHPQAKISQKLLAADLEIRQHNDQRAQIEQREIERWKNAGDQDLAVLAAWLCRHGELQKALDAVPVERALHSRELFTQTLDTLGALGRWAEAKQLLGREGFPLDPSIQAMYLARCNAQLGEKTAAENNWKRALESAAGDTGKLLILADYAEKNGNAEVAGQAYERAAAETPALWLAQQGRLRIAQRSGDTKRIHTVLADMLRLRPDDRAVRNEEAYTRALLLPAETKPDATELKAIEAIARNLLETEPESLPHRTLLALVFLKENRSADALALYNGLKVPQKELTPSTVVVHAAVLAANGRQADARTEMSHLPKEKVLPEERAIVGQL
jgi:hypothetical protein